MSGAIRLGLFALCAAAAPAVSALDFEFSDGMTLDLKHRFTLGAAWRTQDRSSGLIGKINLNPSLCNGDDCRDFGGDPAPNLRLVAAPGGLAAHNQDNGNLNYDKGDMVFATAKLASEVTFKWGEFTAFIKGSGIYDAVNSGFEETHPDTRFQPAKTPRKQVIEDQVGQRLDLLDAFISYPLQLGERTIHFTLGEQRIRWGEANTIQLNSIGEINPPDQNQLYFPGVELADIFLPVGLFTVATDLTDTLALEMVYQYRWEPIRPAAAGSFLSTSDIAGGGDYAVISEGQFSEDPEFIGTPQGSVALISSSSSSVGFLPENQPSDGDQYGISLRGFLPEFNNGTEWGLYYFKYHSRLPYAGIVAVDESCWRDSGNVAEAFVDCLGFNGSNGAFSLPVTNTPVQLPPLDTIPLPTEIGDPIVDGAGLRCHRPRRGSNTTVNPTGQGCDPVTLDTLGVFLDYPEDIHMFGASFNTTIGLWSLAGEYSYRPNLPAQVQLQDVVFAGVNPTFPRQEIFIPGVATIPTASIAAPDYLETRYRGNTNIQGNSIIRGYERLKVGQLSLTGIRIFPSSNLFAADQILLLVEAGFTQVYDMPGLNELQFDGGSANATHFSPGADSTGELADARRIVPTMQTDDFADDFAWGYRVLVRAEYNALTDWAPVIRPIFAIFHDVKGVSISPMQNFIEGRRQFLSGLQFEFNEDMSAQVLYQWYTGGGALNKLSDRDNFLLSLAYNF